MLAWPAVGRTAEPEAPSDDSPHWREKPLRTTVGISPTARDLGDEADLFLDDPVEIEHKTREWKLDMKAFFRGVARMSYGPAHDGGSDFELHSPARIPGLSSGDWDHIGVIPNPSAKAFFSAGTPAVTANVIIGGRPPIDQTWNNLNQFAWVADAYVTVKFPRAFGDHGGIAWTAGSFGHRYGNAGRNGTGYYRTLLFGRTRAMSSIVTADFDLDKHWELIFEHGIGAKLDVRPFADLDDELPNADFLPSPGDTPRGSNFLHHGHLQLRNDYWLRLGAHWMTSWTPNDRTLLIGQPAQEARLTVYGVEMNVDLPTSNGFIGYSHIDANDILPLSNALQVLHGSRGTDFKNIYFGFRDRATAQNPTNDSGTVDTVLFQYIHRLAPVLNIGPDFDVGVFGMFAHVDSPIQDPNIASQFNLKYSRLKWGVDVVYELLPFMRAGVRFDNVNSELGNPDLSFSALSPRLVFYTKKGSKELIVLNYSYFFYGDDVFAGSPFRSLPVQADPHFFGITALMSL